MKDDLRLHGVAVYNPALWSREELKGYFVARTELLSQIVAALRQEKPGEPCQHRLILGQRGMGKSTLLRRIGIAVEEDEELGKQWLPLTFPEEQYNISSIAVFWRNCLDALCDALEKRGDSSRAAELDAALEILETLPDDAALERLLAEAGALGFRLLLLIDNVDLIFERLKKEQAKLRKIFANEPRLMLIGASTRAVEDDFFSITDKLKGLTEAEMRATLSKLAELGKTPQVAKLLDDDPARIKTLHTLTGGNPRTVVLLYNVLARGLDGDVRSDLEGLLDMVTPLYKARFEELPQQAQQLVDGLAINWDPMTARQLAEKLGWDVNTVSSQLNRLHQQDWVEKVEAAKGGRIAFQIGERFFNIWYLMRASRRVRRKLIWLVHFLRMFFNAAELQGHAKKLLREKKSDVRWAEYKLALAQTVKDNYLKNKLNRDGLRCLCQHEKNWRKIEAMFDLDGEDAELRPLLKKIIRDFEVDEAISQAIKDGVMSSGDDVEGAERAAELYDKPEIAANAWYWLLLFNEKPLTEQQAVAAENAYRKAINVDPANAKNYRYLGRLLDKLKRFDEAEQAYRKAVELAPDDAYRWSELAWFLQKRGRFDEEEQVYRKAVELAPDDAYRWSELARFLKRCGRFDEAEQAYRKMVEIDPANSSRYNTLAWFLYERRDKFDEAIAFAKKSVELEYDLHAVHTLATLLVANNQWPEAEPHIRALLAKGNDDFFEANWQNMLALFKEAVRTGKAKEALRLLDESPLAERWRPLREALAAAAEGTIRYLNGVAPEVRQPALEILKTIAPALLPEHSNP
jgi:Flp pilus assembly protein TadD/DNA-binding transcriptional regulator GbsR (MarR family)